MFRGLVQAAAVAATFLGAPVVAAPECSAVPFLDGTRDRHLEMTNGVRLRQEVGALTASARLDRVAQDYACLLAATGHFDHVGPDGSTLSQRAEDGGYDFCAIAENLARGQTDLVEALKGWIDSPGHWRNLIFDEVTELGFGAAYLDPEAEGRKVGALSALFPDAETSSSEESLPHAAQQIVWVQLFGRPCD